MTHILMLELVTLYCVTVLHFAVLSSSSLPREHDGKVAKWDYYGELIIFIRCMCCDKACTIDHLRMHINN